MQKILPAIMPYSFDDFVQKADRVDDMVNWVQVDVMDGVFVPSESWPYNGTNLDEFKKIISQEDGLPGWKKINFIADLMISDVEERVYDWINAGVGQVIIHIESLHNQVSAGIVAKLKEEFGSDLDVGVAISTATPNEALVPFLDHVDVVQFMGIENVGFQGQEFDTRVIEKVATFKKENPNIPVVIDGAMNAETIPQLVAAGADRFVVGSALYESSDIKETYDALEHLANSEDKDSM